VRAGGNRERVVCQLVTQTIVRTPSPLLRVPAWTKEVQYPQKYKNIETEGQISGHRDETRYRLIATGIAGVPFVQVGNAQATFRMGACRITGDLVRDEDNGEVLSTRLKRQY
jgi:hypothetical protein